MAEAAKKVKARTIYLVAWNQVTGDAAIKTTTSARLGAKWVKRAQKRLSRQSLKEDTFKWGYFYSKRKIRHRLFDGFGWQDRGLALGLLNIINDDLTHPHPPPRVANLEGNTLYWNRNLIKI